MDNPDLGPNMGAQSSPLVARVKNILLQPKSEWLVIDAEPATVGGIYSRYVIILAAIPAICALIGGLAIGHTLFGVTYRPSVTGAVAGAAVSYALSLVEVYLLAWIIDTVAPNFDATPNRVQAFKVAAYSGTAGWVAGILQIIPALGMIAALLGLYGAYLLYLGLPRLMKAPEEKAMGYTAVTIVCAILLAIVVGAITAPVAAIFYRAAPAGEVSGNLTLPGVGSLDVGKLEAAADKLQAQANNIEAAGNAAPTNAVPAAQLQALLPGALPGLPRTEISSASGSAAGIGGSNASARYMAGESSVNLEVTDMAAIGALATLGGALNVQSSRQTETGYEKTETVDGRMTTEEWNSTSKSGKFSVVVGSRFLVEARGQNVDMNQLKGAVIAVGIGKLEALAK